MFWLAVPKGVRRAHLATPGNACFYPAQENIVWSRLTNRVCNFWTMLGTELQKETAGDNKNKENIADYDETGTVYELKSAKICFKSY